MSKYGPTNEGLILKVESIGPKLKKYIVQDPKISSLTFIPGFRLVIEAEKDTFRDYSLSKMDRENGTMEVYAYLHNFGPGSRFMSALKEGDKINYIGPVKGTAYTTGVSEALIFGDETSIASILSFFELSPTTTARAVVEAEKDCLATLQKLDSRIEAIEKTSVIGEASLKWIEAQAHISPDTHVFISGQDLVIQKLKNAFIESFQLPEEQIKSTRHWFEGKALR